MSLEKEFEETWKTVSEERNKIDDFTDQKIWDKINSKIKRKNRIKKWYWAAAAVVVPFFTFLMIYHFSQNPDIKSEAQYVYESFEKVRLIKLSDGSVIKLMPHSRLTISESFGVTDREVLFTGHGDFNISKDLTKPFRINAGDFYVQVLGTHFFLDQKSEEKKVALFEGKVKVEHGKQLTCLLPEEVWISNKNNPDYHYYSPKKQKAFTFDNTKYSEAIRQLENIYHINISYPDQYRDRKVSGSFTGNLNDILGVISFPFNLKPEKINETEIILK